MPNDPGFTLETIDDALSMLGSYDPDSEYHHCSRDRDGECLDSYCPRAELEYDDVPSEADRVDYEEDYE